MTGTKNPPKYNQFATKKNNKTHNCTTKIYLKANRKDKLEKK